MPMFHFSHPEFWWLFSGIFYAIGIIAFANTIITVNENLYHENFNSAIPIIRIELILNIILCAYLSLLAICAWIIYPTKDGGVSNLAPHEPLFFCSLGFLVTIMVGKSQFWFLQKIYHIGGLK